MCSHVGLSDQTQLKTFYKLKKCYCFDIYGDMCFMFGPLKYKQSRKGLHLHSLIDNKIH